MFNRKCLVESIQAHHGNVQNDDVYKYTVLFFADLFTFKIVFLSHIFHFNSSNSKRKRVSQVCRGQNLSCHLLRIFANIKLTTFNGHSN